MDATKLIEEAGRVIASRKWPMYLSDLLDSLAAALRESEERARKAEAMYRQRDADVTAWQRTATDLYTGNPPSEPSMAAGLKLMQEHMRQRDQAKACIQKAEQDRDALAAANLAANKRIVDLEHDRDTARRQAQENAEHALDIARDRDAARAELARLTTPLASAELAQIEREHAIVAASFDRDGVSPKDSAEAHRNRGVLLAEIRRLTTPRPIAEAPRDMQILGYWEDRRFPVIVSTANGAVWFSDFGAVRAPSHYLPLPEVKP